MNRVLIRSECYTQDKRTQPEKDFKIWMNRSPSLTYREVENRTVCQKRKADTKITISPFDPDNDNDEKMKSSGAVPLKKKHLKDVLLSRSIHDAIPPSPNIYKDSLFICLLDKIMITVMIYYFIIKIKEERSLPPASLDLFCRHLHVKIIAENPVPADFEANKVAVPGSRNLLWIEFPPRKHVIFP